MAVQKQRAFILPLAKISRLLLMSGKKHKPEARPFARGGDTSSSIVVTRTIVMNKELHSLSLFLLSLPVKTKSVCNVRHRSSQALVDAIKSELKKN